MAENTAMPLWLDIKKEYIDENLDGVLNYLHKRVKNTALQDSFYQTTVNLLQERVKSLIKTITDAPLQENMCKDEDLALVCRMCAMYLLVFPEDCELRRNAYSLMVQTLLLLSHQYEQELAELSIANLLGRVSSKLAFSWDDIIDFQPNILTYKVANSTAQNGGRSEDYWYEDKGSVLLKKGVLALSSLPVESPTRALLVPAVELLDGQIQIIDAKGLKDYAQKYSKDYIA